MIESYIHGPPEKPSPCTSELLVWPNIHFSLVCEAENFSLDSLEQSFIRTDGLLFRIKLRIEDSGHCKFHLCTEDDGFFFTTGAVFFDIFFLVGLNVSIELRKNEVWSAQ